MTLQRGEVTTDMVSTVPWQFWKDDLVSPVGGSGGKRGWRQGATNPIPCKPLHEGPKTPSPSIFGRGLPSTYMVKPSPEAVLALSHAISLPCPRCNSIGALAQDPTQCPAVQVKPPVDVQEGNIHPKQIQCDPFSVSLGVWILLWA